MTSQIRPRPRSNVWETPFWSFVEERRLHLQSCTACARSWYPPGPGCPHCLSESWTWEPVQGHGVLLSFTTFHRQYFDTMPPPHTVVAVELAEGPILIADTDTPTKALSIGARMRLAYHRVVDDAGVPFTLYRWGLDAPAAEPSRQPTPKGNHSDG